MDNDKKKDYWFKRRRYGYGWVPVTWQGWLTLGVLLVVVLGGAWVVKDAPQGELSDEVAIYLAAVLASVLVLLFISNKKGPSLRWRWGETDQDDPDEDY